jgi:hypothetical protein
MTPQEVEDVFYEAETHREDDVITTHLFQLAEELIEIRNEVGIPITQISRLLGHASIEIITWRKPSATSSPSNKQI